MSPVARHLALACGLGAGSFVLFAGARATALARPQPGRPPSRAARVLTGVAPGLIAAVLFVLGLRGYVDAAVAPADALEVTATAADWRWHFRYADGTTSDDDLRVPAGRPVHVSVVSRERIHRFDLPALRAGTEAGPDADGSLWFVAPQPAQSAIGCGVACAGHPDMRVALRVLDPAGWRAFTDDGSLLPPAQYGAKLYQKATCVTCHSLDGKPGVAPSFKGLFGRRETLADGSSVLVDAAYLRQSILDPTAKVVRGFQPVMPPFAGQLREQQVDALVAFIESVKP